MDVPHQLQNEFGVGIYSYLDAARLIGASPRAVRRWMCGYAIRCRGEKRTYAPLWSSQLTGTDTDGIGFRDMIELRFVHTFVAAGVPLLLVRHTIEELRERLGRRYPFTSAAFRTDGRRIFMDLLGENGDRALVDVVKRQNVMQTVIGPSLRRGIELNVDDEATRWYPVSSSQSVVLDPQRSFGQPILARSGVPTVAVAEAVQAEGGDEGRVARLYEIPIRDVRSAVAFEQQARAA